MPTFKQKNTKKCIIIKKNTVTLDSKHKQITETIKKDTLETIPQLKHQKNQLLKLLKHDNLTIDEKLNKEDHLKEIISKIKLIKKRNKEYFLNNSNYIFDYFEDKKNISENTNDIINPNDANDINDVNNINNINNANDVNDVNDIINKTTKSTYNITKSNMLNNFFNIKDKPINDNVTLNTNTNTNTNNININDTEINNNKELSNVQKYMLNNDESFLNINNYVVQTDICRFCNNGELIPIDHEGILLCNVCSKSVKYLIDNDKPSYKEPPKEVCFYAYKRINHFREILAQFQAKESTQIPDEVIENIKLQIKKERLTIFQLNNKRAKEILKKLGYNKYYEHIPFIKDRLGIKPPIMSAALETTLCNLFMDIQSPYAKYCPDDRVNFLNYYYTIYKLCELLGQDQFLPFFPMLKDREKRIEQDEVWSKICQELNWEFIPTI